MIVKKMKKNNLLDYVLRIFAWISIAISPFLIGIILSLITYFVLDKSIFAITFALIIGILFLFISIYFANKMSKKKGSIEFISNIRATPELDHLKNQNE